MELEPGRWKRASTITTTFERWDTAGVSYNSKVPSVLCYATVAGWPWPKHTKTLNESKVVFKHQLLCNWYKCWAVEKLNLFLAGHWRLLLMYLMTLRSNPQKRLTWECHSYQLDPRWRFQSLELPLTFRTGTRRWWRRVFTGLSWFIMSLSIVCFFLPGLLGKRRYWRYPIEVEW